MTFGPVNCPSACCGPTTPCGDFHINTSPYRQAELTLAWNGCGSCVSLNGIYLADINRSIGLGSPSTWWRYTFPTPVVVCGSTPLEWVELRIECQYPIVDVLHGFASVYLSWSGLAAWTNAVTHQAPAYPKESDQLFSTGGPTAGGPTICGAGATFAPTASYRLIKTQAP